MPIRSMPKALLMILCPAFLAGCGGEPGQVRVSAPGTTVSFSTGWWSSAQVSSEAVSVPSGRYTPSSVSLRMTKPNASQSDTWRLECRGPFGGLGGFQVRPGQLTVLQAGPPLTVKPVTNVRGRDVYVALLIVGQAGEVYTPPVYKNERSLPLPRLKIVDAAGRTLNQGSFEYG
ncbi:MAG: hypothetical protein JXQ73_27450 [Phycisphaerae bacterium]|nr:hypothetical protein [Phycisphaerae bacterium]